MVAPTDIAAPWWHHHLLPLPLVFALHFPWGSLGANLAGNMTFSFKLIIFWLNQDGYTPQGFTPGLQLGGRSSPRHDSEELPISLASPSLVGWLDQQLLGGKIIFTGMVGKGVAASSHCLWPFWVGGNHRILCLAPVRRHQTLQVGT